MAFASSDCPATRWGSNANMARGLRKDSMKHVIFFPADNPLDPEDPSALCGSMPHHVLKFPRMVWYNNADQHLAEREIAALNVAAVVLVGFSKSGLGAIRVALRIPDLVRGLLIFDAPLNMPQIDGQGDPAGQHSLVQPQALARAMHDKLHPSTRIVLIGGERFHSEMRRFSGLLTREAVAHNFMDRPTCAHRWDSGWMNEGLEDMLCHTPTS